MAELVDDTDGANAGNTNEETDHTPPLQPPLTMEQQKELDEAAE